MTKRVSEMRIELLIDPVNGIYTMRKCFFSLDDDTDASISSYKIAGPNPCDPAVIEAGDLSGTLQTYLNSLQTDIETQEGI